ncbi:MAG TPA: sulfur oxidation c-type cytochrome SoxX [Burkholderiaceae bacterium]|jgi:sulfur-oxidizing protein SoxX|nr:sulfur oxidation c-type cytochrome SoxX [Burkholderiaceae bacterium]
MHPVLNVSLNAKKVLLGIVVAAIAVGVLGCASKMNDAPVAQPNLPSIKASFTARGVAGLDRLDQDEVQRLCTEYAQKPLPPEVAAKIQQSQMATIIHPASGKLIGNWKAGEALAQEGRGLQFSDKAGGPQGGNCYACHQLTHEEIAYGNVGPSLLNYGKLRGASDAVVQYTYAKLYNSQAYAACSNMPRFGHNHILTPEQIADIVALLMDPQSPVNR